MGVALAAASLFACMPRQSGDPSEGSPTTEEPGASVDRRCTSGEPGAVAILAPNSANGTSSESCGVSVGLDAGQLTLREIPAADANFAAAATGTGEILATGPIPEECGPALERCELWGVVDELGPLLLLSVRGPESEVPVQVYVGWVSGAQLGFAASWYGEPSVADHTRVGPAWALAPFECQGELELLPRPRLPEAAAEQPSVALRAAAGRWNVAADGSTAIAAVDASTGEGCRPVFTSVP